MLNFRGRSLRIISTVLERLSSAFFGHLESPDSWPLVLTQAPYLLRFKQLSGWQLSGWQLSGWQLSGWQLSGWQLSGWQLSGWKLSGWQLSGWQLSGRQSSGLQLSGLQLSGWQLSCYLKIYSSVISGYLLCHHSPI